MIPRSAYQKVLWICAALSQACTTAQPPPERPKVAALKTQDQMPLLVDNDANLLPDYQFLDIPESALDLKTIARAKVEVREGPGVQYGLLDRVLTASDLLIQIGSTGVWRKIYEPKTETIGWVHAQTLKPAEAKRLAIRINKAYLSKVFTNKDNPKGETFQLQKSFVLKASKGAPFYALQKKRDKILVVIGATKSLVWLSKRDAL